MNQHSPFSSLKCACSFTFPLKSLSLHLASRPGCWHTCPSPLAHVGSCAPHYPLSPMKNPHSAFPFLFSPFFPFRQCLFLFPGIFVLSARTYGVLERTDFKTVVFSVTMAAVQVSGNSTTYFRIFFFPKGSHSALRLSRHSCSSCVA